MEVPEGIPLDLSQGGVTDDAALKVFEEECVQDVNEMKDLVEGYRNQNHFLNQELLGMIIFRWDCALLQSCKHLSRPWTTESDSCCEKFTTLKASTTS